MRTAPPSVVIRSTAWLGGGDDSIKQRGALDKCDATSDHVAGYKPGYKFDRATNNAVRWTRGATVFGVNITARSGFSKNVTLHYSFGGPPGKAHYICGSDGKESPTTAGRIFSGAVG